MVIAFFIRIYGIGFLSLWIDECIHALAAKQYAETGHFEVADNNGILLTIVNCVFVKLFGLSEFVLRLPLALSGTLLVPLSYLFGKKIVNLQTGLLTALLACFSPYLIFWSRVDRMYEFVTLFYLTALILFWILYEHKGPISLRVFSKQLTLKKSAILILLLASFLFALLSQVQAILFLLTIGFYGSLVAIHGRVSKNRIDFRQKKYGWLLVLTTIGILVFFTPLTNVITKPIIDHINGSEGFAKLKIPGWISAMLAPDWKIFGDFLSSADWNKYFLTYYRVTINDYPALGILGWLGFIASLFYQRRSAYYLIAAFIVPVITMGFFLREPNEPRYLCFIYPVFLCSTAVFLSVAISKLAGIFNRRADGRKRYTRVAVALAALVIVAGIPYSTIYHLISSDIHGHQLKRELAGPAFVNWKEPGLYVKEKMKPGDIVFSTVKLASDFYTDAPSFPFRQYHIDLVKKSYIPNHPRPFVPGANSFEEFARTVATTPGGWLLVDHYLYSNYVDQRLVGFIHQNLDFHPEASKDGSVLVFSWGAQKPTTLPSRYITELGKQFSFEQVPSPYGTDDRNMYSAEFLFNGCSNCYELEARFYSAGIDYTGEAAIIVNEAKMFIIPKPDDPATGESVFKINPKDLGGRPGDPIRLRFVYRAPENEDTEQRKGYYIKAYFFNAFSK